MIAVYPLNAYSQIVSVSASWIEGGKDGYRRASPL